MTFNDYQERALDTVIAADDPLLAKTIWAMGIAGEAGEVVEKWKKIVAYQDGKMTESDLAELGKEMGDVIWYIAVMAHDLGLSLEDVALKNLQKLQDRQKRNVLKGRGDNR